MMKKPRKGCQLPSESLSQKYENNFVSGGNFGFWSRCTTTWALLKYSHLNNILQCGVNLYVAASSILLAPWWVRLITYTATHKRTADALVDKKNSSNLLAWESENFLRANIFSSDGDANKLFKFEQINLHCPDYISDLSYGSWKFIDRSLCERKSIFTLNVWIINFWWSGASSRQEVDLLKCWIIHGKCPVAN